MKKKIFFILLLIFFVPTVKASTVYDDNCSINEETDYKACILDDDKILENEEESYLIDKLKEMTSYANVILNTRNETNIRHYVKTDGYIYEILSRKNLVGKNTIVIVIDPSNEDIYIRSEGNINSINSHITTDEAISYLKNGQYYLSAITIVSETYSILSFVMIPEYMKILNAIIVSISCSLIISFLYIWSKMYKRKSTIHEIVKYRKLDLTTRDFKPIYIDTEKIYSPND